MTPADPDGPGSGDPESTESSSPSSPADATSASNQRDPAPRPLSTADALRELDDRAFVELVTTLWERREWAIEEVRERESQYVDLAVRRDWPVAERGLLRIERPDSDTRIGGTEVRHFVRTVQGAAVDWSTLVLPRVATRSVRRQAAEFDVSVVDVDELERLIHRREAYDLLARHVDRPLVVEADPIVARAPDRVAGILRRFDVVDRAEGLLDRHLPQNPTGEDLAGLTFVGFRLSLTAVLLTFLLTVVAPGGSAAFWLLMGLFLLATYGILLPVMAADVYVVRRFEPGPWTPTWWLFAAFLLAPALFVVGAVYWHRRRQRTPSGRAGAWFRSE